MSSVLVINGPNLNLLGEREPAVYGSATLADVVEQLRAAASDAGLGLEHVQSNHEGEITEAIQGARGTHDAIIINAGAFTHYSWAIADALGTFEGMVVEVHISNPEAREPWRHTSVVSPVADGTISGLGTFGYLLALSAVRERLSS